MAWTEQQELEVLRRIVEDCSNAKNMLNSYLSAKEQIDKGACTIAEIARATHRYKGALQSAVNRHPELAEKMKANAESKRRAKVHKKQQKCAEIDRLVGQGMTTKRACEEVGCSYDTYRSGNSKKIVRKNSRMISQELIMNALINNPDLTTGEEVGDYLGMSTAVVNRARLDRDDIRQQIQSNRKAKHQSKMEHLYEIYKGKPKGCEINAWAKKNGVHRCALYRAKDHFEK